MQIEIKANQIPVFECDCALLMACILSSSRPLMYGFRPPNPVCLRVCFCAGGERNILQPLMASRSHHHSAMLNIGHYQHNHHHHNNSNSHHHHHNHHHHQHPSLMMENGVGPGSGAAGHLGGGLGLGGVGDGGVGQPTGSTDPMGSLGGASSSASALNGSTGSRRDHNIDYSSLFVQLTGTFPTLYRCVSCHKTVSNRWHHANIHRPQSHECPVCGQKFTRRDNMKAHCKIKHADIKDRFFSHYVHM